MRKVWRWVIHGKPKPIPTIYAEYRHEDPRTDALKAIAVSLENQNELFERFVVASESVAAALDRAEKRALEVETKPLPSGD